jgi:hypothetical protein
MTSSDLAMTYHLGSILWSSIEVKSPQLIVSGEAAAENHVQRGVKSIAIINIQLLKASMKLHVLLHVTSEAS